VGRAAAYQLHPLSRQIAHRAVFGFQYGSCWQYSQSQQMGKVACIGFIAAVFETLVFLDRCRMGQVHRESRILESVDQPVPIESGFNHDACQF
jgi:hypothetical protein